MFACRWPRSLSGARLMGRIDKAARVMAIEDLASLDKVAAELVG